MPNKSKIAIEKSKIAVKIRKLKVFLGKLLVFSVRHFSLTSLFIFFLTLIFGALLFYKYSVLVQKIEFEPSELLQLKEKTYQDILKIWQEQEKKFIGAESKKRTDPFKRPVPITEEELESEESEPEELTE